MILEKELYNSINGTRSIAKAIVTYGLISFRRVFTKERASVKVYPRKLISLSDSSKCSDCDLCSRICPTNCLSVNNSKNKIQLLLDIRACTFCGLCIDVCPEKVLSFDSSHELSSHGESEWVIDLAQSLS